MSAGKQSPEPTKESSSSELVSDVRDTSESRELSVGLDLQDTREPSTDFTEKLSDNTGSDTVSEGSVCSKCGGTKLFSRTGGTKPFSETDLEPLLETQLICKCGSELNETQVETKTNMKSDAKVFETEKTETENQFELGESSKEKLPVQEGFSDNFVENINDVASESGNRVVSVDVEPKPLSAESGQKKSGSKLIEIKDEEKIPLLQQHTDATEEEIVQMEEGSDRQQSPAASNEPTIRDVMANYPSHIRCTEDSDSPRPNRPTCWDENFPFFVLGCVGLLLPLLIIIAIVLAFQIWGGNKNGIESNITKDFDRNSTADED